MSFQMHSGKWTIKWMRKKASTAFTALTLVADSSDVDTIEPADSSDAEVRGIVLRTVASTDADYASNTRVPVAVPADESAEVLGDISTGTIAITDEGNEIDLTDAAGGNASASSTDILKILRFVSTTKAIFKINKLG